MKSLKLTVVGALLTLTACGCARTPDVARRAFLSNVFTPSAAKAEAVAVAPVSVSMPQLVQPASDVRACARAHSDGPPIIERSDAATPRRVALTFDDGPHISYTPKVLDALKAHDKKATFFLVGRAINGKTFQLVQRTLREGHTLAVHSYNHEVEMATHFAPEKSQAYIVGQYETTRILIELSLVATSEQDFDEQYTRIFGVPAYGWISEEMLATRHAQFARAHADMLAERGFADGARPVDLVFFRPPGGGPYLALNRSTAARKTYDAALTSLGAINVMWHGGSGDTDSERRHDRSFLMGNLRHASRLGGVMLLHDPIDKVALNSALTQMDADGVQVVTLEQIAREKLGCP